jgi:hypothetical protein
MTLAEIMDEDRRKKIIEIMQARADNDPETQELVRFLVVNNVDKELIIKGDKDFLKRLTEQVKKKIEEMREASQRAPPVGDELSCYVDEDGDIVEEIVNDCKPKFVCWKENDMTIDYPTGKFTPIDDEILRKRVVLLPTGVEDYESDEKLIDDLKKHIVKYMDVDDEFLEQAVYYILLSWVYDRLTTVPYLRALGDTGTGKSRFLHVIGSLCYKPMKITGAASPAAIFRIIEKWKGTLIIEEADRKQSDTADDVIKILNCGYEKDNPVVRCDKEKPNDIEVHDVYGPKVLSSRQTFYDKALESRCVTYVTQETRREDIPPLLPPSFDKNSGLLRNKLLLWRLKNWNRIDINVLEDPAQFGLTGVEPRLRQTAMPFLVLFTNEALRKKFIDYIKKYQIVLIDERAESDEGLLVNAYYELKNAKQERITATDLMNFVNEDLKDKSKWSKRKVGSLIRSMGFKSTHKTVGGENLREVDIDEKQYDTLLRRYNSQYFLQKMTEVTKMTDITDTLGGESLESTESGGESTVTAVISVIPVIDEPKLEVEEIIPYLKSKKEVKSDEKLESDNNASQNEESNGT